VFQNKYKTQESESKYSDSESDDRKQSKLDIKYENESENEEDIAPPKTSDKSTNNNNNNNNNTSNIDRDREDHRLTGYRTGATSSTNSRLHGHIRNESDAKVSKNEEDNEHEVSNRDDLDAKVSVSNNDIREEGETMLPYSPTSGLDDMEDVNINNNSLLAKHNTKAKAKPKAIVSKSNGQENKENDDDAQIRSSNTTNTNTNTSTTSSEEQQRSKPIRRAYDELDVNSSNNKKMNIDDFLDGPGRADAKEVRYDSDDDDKDGKIDLQKEKQRYYTDAKGSSEFRNNKSPSSSSIDSRSRSNSLMEQHLMERDGKSNAGYTADIAVPRPPMNSPPEFAQQVANNGIIKKLHNNNNNNISSNRHDDWDVDNVTRENDKKKNINNVKTGQNDPAAVAAKFGIGSGVRADENWLDDDFDS